MSTINIQKVLKRMNVLIGGTVLNVIGDEKSYDITIAMPDGMPVNLYEWSTFDLKKKDAKTLIENVKVVTLKHQDECATMDISADKVSGAIIKKVNIYANNKNAYMNRVTISIQLQIPDTNKTPGILITVDFKSDCKIEN